MDLQIRRRGGKVSRVQLISTPGRRKSRRGKHEREKTENGEQPDESELTLVYQPFRPKPREPITITYLFVCIPTSGEQFETLCQFVRSSLERKIKQLEQLKQEQPELYEQRKGRYGEPYSERVRKNLADVVLEFYGIPRNNPEIADFLADQQWYPVREPRELSPEYRQLLLEASSPK